MPRVRALQRVNDVWVAGCPSDYGGAGTELDHLAELLQTNGYRVHFVPMPALHPREIGALTARGFDVVPYRNDVFADKVVLAFCNSLFLARLAKIHYYGPPRTVVWFSCMADLFPLEPIVHQAGWIDYFGFVSAYQRRRIEAELARLRPVRALEYQPFLNVDRYKWNPRRDSKTFHIGRISRDDPFKYPGDLWITYDNVRVPRGVRKRAFVLGYGPAAAIRTGPPPPTLDTVLWAPRAVPASLLYENLDVLLYRPGGCSESYCRIIVEAYAHGVVPIVPRAFSFPELVRHGETGFLADESTEMTEYASWLAHNPRQRLTMASNGLNHLRATLIDAEASLRGIAKLLA